MNPRKFLLQSLTLKYLKLKIHISISVNVVLQVRYGVLVVKKLGRHRNLEID